MLPDNKILVVDDEARIRSLVKMYLEKEAFKVEEAADGKEALTKIKQNRYSLIILDLMLPETDGMTICRQVRAASDIPIIMLTAKGDELDRLIGFEMGADDYVVKPFSPRELVARVKALLRRAGGKEKEKETGIKELQFGELLIDSSAHRATVNQEELKLTPKEFDLLYYLSVNKGQVFTREQILEKVWGYDYFGDLRTVDTHVKNIREKIADKSDKKFIDTVWGVGYKFMG